MKHVFVEINILIWNISVTQNNYSTVTVWQYCYTTVTVWQYCYTTVTVWQYCYTTVTVWQNCYTTVTVWQYCYTAVTFQMKNAQLTIEGEMQLLCVTGVEDKLQLDIRTTLELLANAGIKVRRGREREREGKIETEGERQKERDIWLIVTFYQVWMLTGDKLETATNIAVSSRLVSRMTPIYQFRPVKTRTEAHNELNNFRKHR